MLERKKRKKKTKIKRFSNIEFKENGKVKNDFGLKKTKKNFKKKASYSFTLT